MYIYIYVYIYFGIWEIHVLCNICICIYDIYVCVWQCLRVFCFSLYVVCNFMAVTHDIPMANQQVWTSAVLTGAQYIWPSGAPVFYRLPGNGTEKDGLFLTAMFYFGTVDSTEKHGYICETGKYNKALFVYNT